MTNTIRFVSMQSNPAFNVQCTFVGAGQPIGHGRDGFADKHKLVIECTSLRDGGYKVTHVIDALTCMHFPNELSVFENVTLSTADTDTLRTWTLKALVAKNVEDGADDKDACPPIDVLPRIDKVNTIRYGSARYAVFEVNGRNQQFLLDDDMPASESLRKTASDFRAKALRYLAWADATESAARVI